MNSRTCGRLWEVEAARDGRLSGRALAAFEEHAAVCRDCGAERRALDSLRRTLASSTAPVDQIALRRERERLLAQADSGLRDPSMGERHGRSVALAVACALAVVVGWATLRAKREPAHPSPIASIVASPGAKWERHRTQGLEQVALTDGVLSLSVRRSASDPRVSLHVPDGDIDDVGTSFRVAVHAGQTREIVVHEGAVLFRQQGKPALLLTSPSVWTAPPAAVRAPTDADPPPPPAPVTPPKQPPGANHEARVHKLRKTTVAPSADSDEGAPADEDLAYLNIVALRREGRSEEARIAAGAYLRKFPQGFRRDEVRSLVREPP